MIFLAYMKRHASHLALCLLFALVFALVFALYDLPVESVLYASMLCLALGLVAVCAGYWRFKRRHRALMDLMSHVTLGLGEMPSARDALENDYQAILVTLYDAMRAREDENARARAELRDYTSLWTHQIKTPLAAMRLLLQSGEKECAEALKAELFKTEQYVDSMLGYARLESDRTDFILRRCALDEIVRRSVRKYARLFILQKIHLSISPIAETVLTDDKGLGFAIEQVLSNALKYTRPDGNIAIETQPGPTLVIRDDGAGIRAEDLPRVFDKGYTGLNGHAADHSTGIGLYLTKRVLGKLSHTIRIESTPGQGTCVLIGLDTRTDEEG